MASNVTRDHHNLRRNLKLNDNYISNDGGDEGIRITDAGLVGIGVTDPDSLLEIFGTSTQLKLSHNADDYATFTVADTGDLTISTVGDGAGDSDLTLDVDGDCIIDSVVTNIRQSGVDVIEFAPASNRIQIRDLLDVNDYLQFTCLAATSGSSTITTVDGGGGHSAYLGLRPDGYLDLRSYGWSHSIAEASGEPITMASGTFVHIDKDLSNTTASASIKGLHVDVDRTGDVSSGTDKSIGIDLDVNVTGASGGIISSFGLVVDVVGDAGGMSQAYGIDLNISGADTCYGIILINKNGGTDFINRSSANSADYFTLNTIAAGNTTLTTVDTTVGATAHLNMVVDGHVEFDGCAVGFDLETPTYNASDTDVSFITGNKQLVTFDGGDIADLNLIFPETSGNFVLLLKQDGTGGRTVTYYKAWDLVNSDAADGDVKVKFPGSSNPTLTTDANHVDIISIFWDADNQIAYGVASLDFQD